MSKASTWECRQAGHHRRVGSDGKTVLAEAIRSSGTWDVYVYPKGKVQLEIHRVNYRTLANAKGAAEILYRNAVTDLANGVTIQG